MVGVILGLETNNFKCQSERFFHRTTQSRTSNIGIRPSGSGKPVLCGRGVLSTSPLPEA